MSEMRHGFGSRNGTFCFVSLVERYPTNVRYTFLSTSDFILHQSLVGSFSSFSLHHDDLTRKEEAPSPSSRHWLLSQRPRNKFFHSFISISLTLNSLCETSFAWTRSTLTSYW